MNAVDTHDLIERAAHLARLGWAVEKLAANAVEFHIDTIRATAAALEWPDLAHAVDKGGVEHHRLGRAPRRRHALDQGGEVSEQQSDLERYGTDSWIDRHRDVWKIGDDGLLHTPETKPFPGYFVERKWGPLRKVKAP